MSQSGFGSGSYLAYKFLSVLASLIVLEENLGFSEHWGTSLSNFLTISGLGKILILPWCVNHCRCC